MGFVHLKYTRNKYSGNIMIKNNYHPTIEDICYVSSVSLIAIILTCQNMLRLFLR